jgi:hypothetical protein
MLILKHYKVKISRELMSLATKLALDAVICDRVGRFGGLVSKVGWQGGFCKLEYCHDA